MYVFSYFLGNRNRFFAKLYNDMLEKLLANGLDYERTYKGINFFISRSPQKINRLSHLGRK